MINESLTILYVLDQGRSTMFYRNVLGMDPVLNVPGMTEFQLGPATKLGLMPEQGIARLLGDRIPNPHQAHGIPRCELYLLVDDPASMLASAIAHGATVLSECTPRDWGDLAGYCADLDGHVLAFAKHLP